MANKKASRESVLQSRRRAVANGLVRSALRTLAKKLRMAISTQSPDAKRIAIDYVSCLDKAAKRNVIHRNSADRHKSACSKYVFG
ncbi:MAG: 30S ribosomal protein S20 [Puniceicoccales bacterium]|jgi:small subunit ribosomal protein S20|nr:30S ribosomal protein S20 [Puniceicoccales bacterium]